VPVALNFRNGPGQALKLQLYEDQKTDVGFLRIFLSTKYCGGNLASVAQNSPLKYENGSWRGVVGATKRPDGRGPIQNDNVADLWDVITIPIVQSVG
jgi:hypothetical protein